MQDGPDRQHQRVRRRAGDGLADRLGAALDRRGMSLTTLRKLLEARGHRVSLATLSYWRSGQRRPESAESLDTLREIEAILDLRAGELLGARGPSRRPGPKVPERTLDELVPPDVPVENALVDLDLQGWTDMIIEESVFVSSDVDARGSMEDFTLRTSLRARVDGAQHYPLYIFAGQPTPEPLDLDYVRGAAITGVVRESSVGFVMWRLSLPAPLRAGETAMLESRIRLSWLGVPDDECIYHVVRRMGEVTVWVRFDPECLPRTCDLVVEDEEGGRRITPVDVSQTHSAHVSVRQFGPGLVGVTIGW